MPERQVFGKIENFRFQEDRIEVFILQTRKRQPFKVMRMLTLVNRESVTFFHQSCF